VIVGVEVAEKIRVLVYNDVNRFVKVNMSDVRVVNEVSREGVENVEDKSVV
jgi:hypothetical protein